ncbi:MAG: hypothetical protein AAGA54_30725 [Myxococcota bacterium]
MRGLRLTPAVAAVVATACTRTPAGPSFGDGDGSTGGAGSDGTTTSNEPSTGSTTSGASTGEASSTAADTTGGPPPLCEAIDISLVLGRQAPIFGLEKRRAVANFLDDLTEQTGARVRIFPNTGAPTPPAWDCSLDADGPADGLTFVWGEDFRAKNNARPRLDCVYQGVKNFPSDTDADGDWMFTGLMFPFLQHDDWPTPERAVSVSMILANTDDDENNMYARPGLSSEAFLRLAAGGDRDRALSFTIGEDADELQTFSLGFAPYALHADWANDDLDTSLQTFLPAVVDACARAEEPEVPEPPGGCEHIDILFVVDGSLSMAEEQEALRGIGGPPVFAEFTDALALSLDSLDDIHVGVISAEPGDTVLHTHRDQPAFEPTPGTDCGLNQPWVVAPSPDLEDDFACIAATAASSTLETTSRNAAEALNDPANAGFLRDDSVLFVVMLTDEDTLGLGATRVQEHQLLLQAVGGDRSRLVMLSIAGDPGVFEAPKTTCNGTYGNAAPGRRLDSIVRSFGDQGITSDICDGDLAQTFDDALDDLVQACVSFVPEG